ncbi:TrkA family potassium uptake protein [Roseibacterium sp. SDUM158017]|uniref:potassium channel family protein n=1 Tax=Roseicyclus salinarum TaxID=3036773 RepID=UPI002414EB45|nr:TrkA family potassium uptake protein [Roseibacterium sp. SDUM158017]MDG4647814.1 TrkA family potassium uptake protein [Roseibacterium sp. SDUM158017]
MRIVILGASRFGEAIARSLIEDGHEVVVIDKSRERLEELAERVDCGMLEGDGTLPTTLREAFRDEDDVFVAVTNASEDNILAALVARSIGFGRVIPQIVSSELMKVCTELELHDVINPHATVAQEFAEALQDRAELDHETTLTRDLALKRVHVPPRMAGQRFGDLELPEGTHGIAHVRDDTEQLMSDDIELKEGDHVLFVLKRDSLEKLSDCFRED